MVVIHPLKTGNLRRTQHKRFWRWFYCTIIKEQAQRWARRYDAKIVSIYDVRLNQDLNIKEFREMTDEGLDFIFCMWSD